WLHYAARILKNIAVAGTDGVGIHQHKIVDVWAHQTERFGTDMLDRSAVGKESHIVQRNASAGFYAARHGVGVEGFYADDLDFRANLFDIGRDACNQAAAAHRHENGVDRVGVVAQNFHGDRALAGDDIG